MFIYIHEYIYYVLWKCLAIHLMTTLVHFYWTSFKRSLLAFPMSDYSREVWLYIRMSSYKLRQFMTSFVVPEKIITFIQSGFHVYPSWNIFTKSIQLGKISSDWNHANVTLVFKKGDKHRHGNYRPISLTCISYKLLQHILQHDETSQV